MIEKTTDLMNKEVKLFSERDEKIAKLKKENIK